jgi:hypothetical protein
MDRYGAIYEARPGWRERLDEQSVSWALLPLDAPLAAAMGADRGWERVRQDAVAVYFHRVGAQR